MKHSILFSVVTAVALGLLLAFTSPVQADDPAVKCEAGKLKEASKYGACRLKAESKAVKKAQAADYTKCEQKFDEKWDRVEGKAEGTCPTNGDESGIEGDIAEHCDMIAAKLSGASFVDNGDGTITDGQTGLMWEKKDTAVGSGLDYANPHDVDNTYTWSGASPWEAPTGTAFSDFLYKLNGGTSTDGTSTSGCFAEHCDWRLATVEELRTIRDAITVCSQGEPCTAWDNTDTAAFGQTASWYYWGASTIAGSPTGAWGVFFGFGSVFNAAKATGYHVRAVRGSS